MSTSPAFIATLFLNRDAYGFHDYIFFAVHQKFELMQNNKLNGFIAKLTQAATKGMKRDSSFKKLSGQTNAEMKENSRISVGFENGLGQIKGMD